MALFRRGKNSVIGLDIGSRTIKLAEVAEAKKGFILKKFGMTDITSGLIEDGTIKNPEAIAEAIRKLLQDNKVKEKNIAISVGGYSVIVKPITVQNMPRQQLQETIQFEAEQYIPFDINDVNLDFEILGEDPENSNQMNVLLVAAKKDIVNDYVNLIEMTGLLPRIMDVDAFALQNIYEVNYDPEDESVALIDIGSAKTTLNIVKGKASILIRDVSLGCSQINEKIKSHIDKSLSLEDAEKMYHSGQEDKISSKELVEIVTTVVTDWCAEIRRALDFFYQTYPGDHIKRIILSGGGANIKKFRELLAEETSSKVEVIDPFESFTIGSGFDQSYLERVAPQAAISLGLALRKVNDKFIKK